MESGSCMKKFIKNAVITTGALICMSTFCFAESLSASIVNTMNIQNHINEIGYKILNANTIEARMTFDYTVKGSKINTESGLRKRQIAVYDKILQQARNDDEIAAILAREICKTAESYSDGKGIVSSVQIKLAPKKYELFFDKRAVDFMVKAGYNPLGLITIINKAYPQKRSDKISSTNLTTKRLAYIYEYIYTKYPYYLKNNEYLKDAAYQNFLMISMENRKKLAEKINSGSNKVVKYE